MSELEIQRREEYKRNRKRWTAVQIVAIILLAVIALGAFGIYRKMNQTYYIEYAESSNIAYKVKYSENDYFGNEMIDGNKAYISSLTESIIADFNYAMNMDSANVSFDYTYEIEAKLLITDKTSGSEFLAKEETLVSQKTGHIDKASSMKIEEKVDIDFDRYNEYASSFVKKYDLRNATSVLLVTLNVDVISSADQLDNDNQNKYSTTLNVPLNEETFVIHASSSVPDAESKVIAYRGAQGSIVFKVIFIASAILALLAILALMIFLHLTKNEDITYVAKIRKILRAYGSYITRMGGEFDSTGYQLVPVKSFTEMLGVRDTLQRPILMSENRDATMTRFLIPTDEMLLYVFEIKVDNYDEIYAPKEEPVETTVEEIEVVDEEPIIVEEVDEQVLAEALDQPDVVLSEIEFDPIEEVIVPDDEPGVEVIGVVWPERAKHNKVYRYDPNGEILEEGDIVLVPTRDVAKGEDVLRKVAVAYGNHRVDPADIKHPLKKIVAIIKRGTVRALTPQANKAEEAMAQEQAAAEKAIAQETVAEQTVAQEVIAEQMIAQETVAEQTAVEEPVAEQKSEQTV